ncbi:SipW-dependent-type signal peptide-containing protein [Archaeoglobus veneficus]|uniref:SipW-cognate class signal peptide n=1 Tax=Archaeoglobus veneficus (strain DSM 11195 / SNP6) TaxID=693661 RepID=F2KN30_ARCVS|nr:SipW-dependent-type signal peptide-containing protein [Archaeoglobus veneficus]AEA47306.1 hypothetical protein Arcve_1300 [Archaeoglobus veneficus SNP6]
MRKIAVPLAAISAIALLFTAGTLAYFSDLETSTNNTFSTGTLDIFLTDGIVSATSAWEKYDWKPGEPLESGELRVWNLGTNKGDHLEFDFELTEYEDDNGDLTDGQNNGPESDTANTTADGMGRYLYIDCMSITWFENDNETDEHILISGGSATGSGVCGNFTYGLYDVNGNGYMDLDDLATLDLDNVAPPELDTNGAYDAIDNYLQINMNVGFNETAGNDYQGDVTIMNVTVTLNQVASQ